MEKGNVRGHKGFIFDFERLDVYQLALDFVHELIGIAAHLPPELRFSVGNNFVRAGMSIPSNIAEGSGKRSKKEKALFYGYALNSARECIPTITVLYREKQIGDLKRDSLRQMCIKICNMLGKLIGSVES